jgi:hypothetical protein
MKTHEEMLRDFEDYLDRVGLRPKPKPPKPKVTVLKEAKPSLGLLKDRHDRSQRHLMEAQLETVRETAAEQNRRVRRELRAQAERPMTPAEALQARLDREWEWRQRAIEEHRERLRGLGPHWYVEPCHRGD